MRKVVTLTSIFIVCVFLLSFILCIIFFDLANKADIVGSSLYEIRDEIKYVRNMIFTVFLLTIICIVGYRFSLYEMIENKYPSIAQNSKILSIKNKVYNHKKNILHTLRIIYELLLIYTFYKIGDVLGKVNARLPDDAFYKIPASFIGMASYIICFIVGFVVIEEIKQIKNASP